MFVNDLLLTQSQRWATTQNLRILIIVMYMIFLFDVATTCTCKSIDFSKQIEELAQQTQLCHYYFFINAEPKRRDYTKPTKIENSY